MGGWQAAMGALARSERVTALMQRRAGATRLASRFIGGGSAGEAISSALALQRSGRASSLFFLGEYVSDPETVRVTIDALLALPRALVDAGLDAHISVDPTQIGLLYDERAMIANAEAIAAEIARVSGAARGRPGRHDLLMIDMEDHGVTDATLALYERLTDAGLPCAVTLQAYLHRTPDDLRRIVARGGRVRLVKGAMAEPARVAHTSRAAVDRAYLELASAMLSDEARERGCFPTFATHDDAIAFRVLALAYRRGWAPSEFEFELLHGVREALAHELVAHGAQVRVYLPFGGDWWPYAIRRVGERPRNAVLLARAASAR